MAFVIPTGYSFNLDGSSLYLSVAAIFVAQVGGIHLSLGQQLVLMLTLMLTSKGVAGVSRASLVILLATATSVGLPTEPVFLLLGVDQLLDMGRTAVNVLGNCLATVVMAKWEGEFDNALTSHRCRWMLYRNDDAEAAPLAVGRISVTSPAISGLLAAAKPLLRAIPDAAAGSDCTARCPHTRMK